jgi:TM2 domain-containing membrane protein YozV
MMTAYDPYNAYQQVSTKSKIAAGLFGLFFGALGVHNFYIGRTGKGLTQLLLSLLSFGLLSGVSALWGFIEGILILCSSAGSPWHQDGYGRELRD